MDQILGPSSDPYLCIQADGGIAYANAAAGRLLGRKPEEIPALGLAQIDPDFDAGAWQQLWQRLQQNVCQRCAGRWRVRGGRIDALELTAHLLRLSGNDYACVHARPTHADDVRFDEIDRLGRTLDAVQSVARLGCWYYEVASGQLTWSRQMRAIFGIDEDTDAPDLKARGALFSGDEWPALEAAVKTCAVDGKPFEMSVRVRRSDGSLRHLSLHGWAYRGAADRIAEVLVIGQDKTELTLTEDALRRSESNYRVLVDNLHDLVVKLDDAGRILFASPSYERVFGARRELPDGPTFSPEVHEEDLAATAVAARSLAQPPHRCRVEHRALTPAGWRWFDWSASALLDADGALDAIVGVGRDVTERKESEQAVADLNARLTVALEGGNIGLYTAEFPAGKVQVDDRYLAMLGYRPNELTLDLEGWRALMHPNDLERIDALIRDVFNGETDRFEAEYRMRHRRGHWVWIMDRARVFERDAAGNPKRTAGTHLDVTRRKQAELKLEYLVDHDDLTGLLNRRGIWQSVHRIHADSMRSGRTYCLAMLDLDFFKQVNDAYGHAAGDRVLVGIGQILRSSLREADWVGRWGGEEFVLVLPGATEAKALVTLERLRREVAERPILVDGHEIRVTLSIGLAICRPAQDTPDDVLDRADGALYRAKTGGRDRVCYNGTDTGAQAVSMAVLVQDALRTAGILPAFQPIVDLRSREIVGEEALARIVDASGHVLTAASFIDVAQQLGLLHRIDRMLFRSALRRLEAGAGVPPVEFVHLSGDLLQHGKIICALAERLQRTLPDADHPLPLVLTISERQIAAGTTQIAESLAPLLELGCRLAVGSFGGESSSFRFLTQLPIGYIEFDSDFLRLATESGRARTVMSGIQSSARELGVTTIAKQVEDDTAVERLIDLGVDWGQGYLFGRPSAPIRPDLL